MSQKALKWLQDSVCVFTVVEVLDVCGDMSCFEQRTAAQITASETTAARRDGALEESLPPFE